MAIVCIKGAFLSLNLLIFPFPCLNPHRLFSSGILLFYVDFSTKVCYTCYERHKFAFSKRRTYMNIERINGILAKKRRRLIAELILCIAASLLCAVLLLTLGERLYVFLPSLIILILSVIGFVKRLKNKTVRLIPLKDGVGAIANKNHKLVDYKPFYGADHISTHSQGKRISGSLKVKCEDGRTVTYSKLSKNQYNFYECGDSVRLLRFGLLPIVTDEPESRQKQLCPICCTVSPDSDACPSCGFNFSD